MQKIKIFVPKDFPSSVDRSDRYAFIGPDALQDRAARKGIRGIAAAGHGPIDVALLNLLPELEIIARFGVGYDNVDVDAARAAHVVVTNAPDVLTDEVADLALGLMIATVRRIPQADRFLRNDGWASGGFPLTGSLRGRRIGILGLGRIGLGIAERVTAMGLDVSYCNRREIAGAPYRYFDTPAALASHCSVLIVVVPGGSATDGLVDGDVIHALGPDGVLINVARGQVVDEPALVDALVSGKLGAAGLDVFADEPNVPKRLLDLENTVLLPHIGSATATTRAAMGDVVFANLDSWFDGNGPLTPIP